MATQGTGSPSILTGRIEALKSGTTKNIAGKTTVVVTGVAMSALEIIARLGHIEKLNEAIMSARAAVKRAVAAYDEAVPGVVLFISNYEASLKGLFGVDHPKLRDFGISPAKSTVTPPAAAKATTPTVPPAAAGKLTLAVRTPAVRSQKLTPPSARPVPASKRPAR